MKRVEQAEDAGESGAIEWVPDELREQSAASEAGETTEWAAALAPAPEAEAREPDVAGGADGPDPGAPDDVQPAERPAAAAAGQPNDGVGEPPESGEDDSVEGRAGAPSESLLAGMRERLGELQRGQEELSERIAGVGRVGGESGDRVAELATALEDLAAQLEQDVGAERLARKRALEEISSRLAEIGGREAEERRRLGDRLIRRCDDSIEHLLESSRHEGEERRWLQESFEIRVATLEGAVERVSEIVSELAERAKPAAETAAPEPPPAAPEAPPAEQLEALRGADLNALTFEQLRTLGLSITQASRLLATRERLGRFTELAQIDDVAGFPKPLRDRLKAELTIGT